MRCLWKLGLPVGVLASLTACSDKDESGKVIVDPPVTVPTPTNLAVVGRGNVPGRYTAEVWVHGNYGYTTTWGTRVVGGVAATGNTVYIWDVRPNTPALADSLTVPGATTTGDVQVSSDGKYLVVPTEASPGSIVTYDLTSPTKPRLLSVFSSGKITRGVHTCEIQTIGGRLTAFLSVNTGASHPGRLMIVDLGDPAQPQELSTVDVTSSFIHDVFVRDGILFAAMWNNGMVIYDIGGGGRGGTLRAPVELGRLVTVGGKVHNIYWYHDGATGSKRFAFIGEEGPGGIGSSSIGDVHVVDVSSFSAPKEVAVFSVSGAGTHNFTVDEANGFLYAAYYNGGVQVLDVRGDLSACTNGQKTSDGRCDLRQMGRSKSIGLLDQSMPVYIWGVHLTGGALYASDMLNGLWRLTPASR